MNALFRFGPVALTRYGLLIALGAAAWTACALGVRRTKYRKTVSREAVFSTAAWMLGLGLVFSRAVYCAVNYDLFARDAGGWVKGLALWEGGHSLSGAFLGALLGIRIGARATGCRAAKLSNCFGPGFLLFACAACAARGFVGEGWGKATEAVWLKSSPLTVSDIYGETRYAVYRMEIAAYAACFLIALIKTLKRGGGTAGGSLCAALYSLFALVFSSMREGNLLRIEYIRIDQVFALLLLIGITLANAPRLLRTRQGKRAAISVLLLLLGAALCAHMEFAVDREGNLEAKYACMLLGSAVATSGALISTRRKQKNRNR